MPNWCNNVATFRHADEHELDRLGIALENERLFSEFVPSPDGDNTAAWGTKWDTGATDHVDSDIDFDKETQLYTLSVSFDTAWSPPITFYERMKELGWKITGYYHEPGMEFCGKWDDGEDDYYDIPDCISEAEDLIPADIDETFNIIEMMRDNQEQEWANVVEILTREHDQDE